MMKIGAQFYTIREHCKTLEELDESLKKVADIGFEDIQLSGVCPYEPEWMAERLKAYGLHCRLTHFGFDRMRNEVNTMIRHHDIIDCKYMGIGGFNGKGLLGAEFDEEFMAKTLASMGPAIDKMYAAGHKFMVHTHSNEFARCSDGRTVLEHFLDFYPAEKMGITLDVYWAHAAGVDEALWLRRLKGRVDCVHFKDMVQDQRLGRFIMAPIGEGNMNYEAIIKACADADVEYGFIEQDDCNGEDPFDCLRRSFKFFRSVGL